MVCTKTRDNIFLDSVLISVPHLKLDLKLVFAMEESVSEGQIDIVVLVTGGSRQITCELATVRLDSSFMGLLESIAESADFRQLAESQHN